MGRDVSNGQTCPLGFFRLNPCLPSRQFGSEYDFICTLIGERYRKTVFFQFIGSQQPFRQENNPASDPFPEKLVRDSDRSAPVYHRVVSEVFR
jgi:hypothetical protein